MKNLEKLKGVKALNKKEQQAVKGGKFYCGDGKPCPVGWQCIGNTCYREMF